MMTNTVYGQVGRKSRNSPSSVQRESYCVEGKRRAAGPVLKRQSAGLRLAVKFSFSLVSTTEYADCRVLSFFSGRRNWWNWDSPNPSPAGECALPPLVTGGGAHSLAREGVGESQFRREDIHCGTLYIYVVYVLCGIHPLRSILMDALSFWFNLSFFLP
jgi:hypothetical protein